MANSGPKQKYPGGVFVWQKQLSSVQCKCGCGGFITNRAARNIEEGKANAGFIHGHIWKGRTLPDSAKEKMRKNHANVSGERNPNFGFGLKGERNPNWQGGKKLRYKKNNHPGACTKADLLFRTSIRNRDGRCILCGNISRLEVHHIVSWVDSTDGRFDPMNCVTLCKPCHVRADNAHHKDRIKPMLLAYIETL